MAYICSMNDMTPSPTRWTPPAERPMGRSLRRGFAQRCPNCGEGRLFGKYLKVVDACPSCGEAMHHHRADDAPPYFTMLIVGHLVVPVLLSVEMNYAPPLWLHMTVWPSLTLILSLALLQPVKGALIGLQWALRMHGFGGVTPAQEDPAGGSAQ